MNIPPPSLLCLLKWEEIFLLKDSKYHKLGLWPHNDSCIVTSRSNDIIRKQNIDFFYLCDEEKQFHCVFPIKNKTRCTQREQNARLNVTSLTSVIKYNTYPGLLVSRILTRFS